MISYICFLGRNEGLNGFAKDVQLVSSALFLSPLFFGLPGLPTVELETFVHLQVH